MNRTTLSAKAPANPATKITLYQRSLASRRLNKALSDALGVVVVLLAKENHRAAQHRKTPYSDDAWTTIRLRNETAVAVELVRKKVGQNMGRDVSRSEIIALALLHALPALLATDKID